MAKNTTRKGLALGAALALTSAGLVATPAHATDLSLVPALGTTYNVFQSDTFTLQSAVTGNTNIANTAAWKWEVTTSFAGTLTVAGTYWNEVTPAYENASLTTSSTGSTKVYTPGATKVTDVIGKVNTITLDPTTDADTATFSVTVRSFSDLDSSGSVTDGDLVSPARTVTFHKGSEVTGTVVLDPLNAGVAATATLTFNKDINLEMITLANVTRTFTVNGTESASAAVTGLNTAKTGIVLTGAATAASQIISGKGLWKRYDGDTTLASASSATSTVAAASTGNTATATLANSENVTDAVAADFVGTALPAAGADSNLNKEVRSGTKTVTFDVALVDSSSVALVAGSPVTVTVEETGNTTLADATVITVGGKELKDAAGTKETITYYTTADSAGKVTVSVASNNGTAGDEVLVLVTSNNATAEVALVWKAAAIDDVYVTNELLNDTIRTITKGSSVSLNYVVVDQFDKPWTRTDYNYRLQFTAGGSATAPSPLVLNNGAATLSYTDNSTAASGSYTLTATLFSQTGAGNWTTETVNHETTLNVVASATAAAAISTATAVLDDTNAIAGTGVPLADKTLAALDNRVYNNVSAALGVTAGKGAKLVATVTSATGANVQGASVTVSGAGLYFSTTAGGSGVVSKDSIVLNTTSTGTATVFVYSQSAGKKTITFTSGSATKTQDVTWASAAASAGSAISLDVPASAQRGTTFKVTGTLVDQYGNPVKMANTATATDPTLSVSYAGPGLVSGSLPTSTDANGQFVFYVLLGSNDSGTATVTASYDADGTTATKSAITASKSVTIGAASVVAGTSVKRTGNTVAVRVTGANARIVLNGVRVASRSTAGVLTRTLTLRAGRNVIQLVVGGEVVRTVRYTR